MSKSFNFTQIQINVATIIGAGFVTAIAGTFSFAQYNNGASAGNNGLFRTNTIQECTAACGANGTCASWVYYTNGAQAGQCQFTISAKPLNIAGAISGVPIRNNVPQQQIQPINQQANQQINQNTVQTNQYAYNASKQNHAKNAENLPPQTNTQTSINPYQGNYGLRPLPNYNEVPRNNVPLNMVPTNAPNIAPTVTNPNNQNNASISFVRPQQQNTQIQQPQIQQQIQTQTQNKPYQTYQLPQNVQQNTQQNTLAPATQYYNSKIETAPVINSPINIPMPQAQQYAQPEQKNVQYQNQIQQATPQYNITSAQKGMNNVAPISNAPINDITQPIIEQQAKPVQTANIGPLRPQLKEQYEKYRGPDGMIDAAAMRRDMIKQNGGPNYSVESEWANIAQNPDIQGAQIYENSAPIPLPSEISEKQIMKEADKPEQPKKKSLWSKIVKRDLNDWDQSQNQGENTQTNQEYTQQTTQSNGPLRKQ